MTKPTGKPRGRPPKPVTPLITRLRGRPRKPLARDSNRYALAIFEAFLRAASVRGISELVIVELLAGLAFGEITPENIARAARGEAYSVWMPPFKLDEHNVGINWRSGNAFRPWADDLRRKLRRLRTAQNEDSEWLRSMSLAWYICLMGGAEYVANARRFAETAGEQEYFEQIMHPELLARHRERGRTHAGPQ